MTPYSHGGLSLSASNVAFRVKSIIMSGLSDYALLHKYWMSRRSDLRAALTWWELVTETDIVLRSDIV
jgi:hypothetical protein